MSGTSCIIVGFSFATDHGCELLDQLLLGKDSTMQ